MGRAKKFLLAFALSAAVATALAACGSSDAQLLPGETAREITDNLEKVKQLTDEDDCVGAESAARQVGEQIEALGGVDTKLKRALQAGAEKLNEVVTDCEEATTEAVAPAEIPSETAEDEEKKPKEKRPKTEPVAPETPHGPPSDVPHGPPSQAEETPEGGESEAVPGEEGAEESPSGGVGPGSPVEGGD